MSGCTQFRDPAPIPVVGIKLSSQAKQGARCNVESCICGTQNRHYQTSVEESWQIRFVGVEDSDHHNCVCLGRVRRRSNCETSMGNSVWHTRQKRIRPAHVQVEAQSAKEVHGCCKPCNELCGVFKGLLGVLRLQSGDGHDLDPNVSVGDDWN